MQLKGRTFYAVTMATSLFVGLLQMYRVRGGWLTDYGADVFGTAWLYAMTRLGKTIFQRGKALGAVQSAMIVFALCVISEFGQKAHVVPGHFDPFDILAFAITVLVCVALDRYAGPFVLSADVPLPQEP